MQRRHTRVNVDLNCTASTLHESFAGSHICRFSRKLHELMRPPTLGPTEGKDGKEEEINQKREGGRRMEGRNTVVRKGGRARGRGARAGSPPAPRGRSAPGPTASDGSCGWRWRCRQCAKALPWALPTTFLRVREETRRHHRSYANGALQPPRLSLLVRVQYVCCTYYEGLGVG